MAVLSGATKAAESATFRSVVCMTMQFMPAKGLLGSVQYCALEGSLVGGFGDAGGGNDDDVGRGLASGHLDETVVVVLLGGSAGDEEVAFGGTVGGRLGNCGGGEGETRSRPGKRQSCCGMSSFVAPFIAGYRIHGLST